MATPVESFCSSSVPGDLQSEDSRSQIGLPRVLSPRIVESARGSGLYAGGVRTILAIRFARLVDVFVQSARSEGFLLGEYILGSLTLASGRGLIIQRSAVLPEDDHYSLFTVSGGRAVKHRVAIGLENDNDVQVTGEGLKAGQQVVVSGNYELKDGVVLAGDALDIEVDRAKAALEGVDPESVTRMLSAYLSGTVTTKIQQGPKMVGVRVWIPDSARSTETDIERLFLHASDGHLFPVKRIASVKVINGQHQIMREDLKQMAAVTGRISVRDMGSVIQDVKKMLQQPGLFPKSVYYDLGGLYAQQQIAFRGLLMVIVAAVVLVFLLLLFLYERFRVAVAILATTLLAMTAVFVGLWLTGTELDISSMMGLTMVVGIVTEVEIFYVSEFYELPDELQRREALVQAGKNRMRPIAMTTFATILALLPLALGISQGAAM